MRKINLIVLHCTATPEYADVSLETFRRNHMKKGWRDIGYHFLIGLDGKVEVGRELEDVGAHVEGFNENSIGIAYVGGIDCEKFQPKDTRTEEQKVSMLALVRQLLEKFPGAKVVGHCDLDKKACPCFSVQKWCKENGLPWKK